MLSQYTTNLIYRKLDENGDYLFGHGFEDFVTGLEAMVQVIRTRLKANYDEWWEGDDTALPWMDEIIGGKTLNKDEIDLMVIERLMDTVGVIRVLDITSSLVDRNYHFSCRVETVYGETTAEVDVP